MSLTCAKKKKNKKNYTHYGSAFHPSTHIKNERKKETRRREKEKERGRGRERHSGKAKPKDDWPLARGGVRSSGVYA